MNILAGAAAILITAATLSVGRAVEVWRGAGVAVNAEAAAASAPAPRPLPALYYATKSDSLRATRIGEAGRRGSGLRILIPLREHRLYVLRGRDTVFAAEAAVPSGATLTFKGRRWSFYIPPALREVVERKMEPLWIPPDWHYVEVARANGLSLRELPRGARVPISQGRYLEARGFEVGIVDSTGRFAPLPDTDEVVIDSTLFIPPLGTTNRLVEGELGRYALDLGDGYLVHGTPHAGSIGQAVTHGCFRLSDADMEWLYRNIPVGTPVYVY